MKKILERGLAFALFGVLGTSACGSATPTSGDPTSEGQSLAPASNSTTGPWLITSAEHFLTSQQSNDANGNFGDIYANRYTPGSWEQFYIVEIGGSGSPNIAIQSAFSGLFVSAEGGGGGLVNARSTEIGPWETFHRIHVDPANELEQWAFQTYYGYLLRAENDGGGPVSARTTSGIGDYETFSVVSPAKKPIWTKVKLTCQSGRTCYCSTSASTHDECDNAVKACGCCGSERVVRGGCKP